MIDLEMKAKEQAILEKKRRGIAKLYKEGKLKKEIALIYNMSEKGISDALKVCIAYGYMTEKEYTACAKKNAGARNFNRAKK